MQREEQRAYGDADLLQLVGIGVGTAVGHLRVDAVDVITVRFGPAPAVAVDAQRKTAARIPRDDDVVATEP